MNKILLALGCAILIMKESFAASFDCDEAKTSMEKAICHDKTISRLDDSLFLVYNAMKESAADPVSLRDQQRAWLSGLRKKYKPGIDLASAYRSRYAIIAKTPTYKWNHYSNQSLKLEFDYPGNRVITADESKPMLKIVHPLAKSEEFDVEIEVLDGDFESLANSKGFEKRTDGWYYPNSRCGDAKAEPISIPGLKGYSAETEYGTSDESGLHACAASTTSALVSNGRTSVSLDINGGDNSLLFARTLRSVRILP